MADNNLDPESFNRLTDALTELNKTMGKSAASPYKAQSQAELREAVVNAKIEKTNKERDLEIARLKRSTSAGDKELLNRKLQDKKTEELTKKYQDQADTLVKLDKAKQKEFDAIEKQLSRQKEIEDANAKLSHSLEGLSKTALKTFGKQLISGSNDQGKFGDTVKILGSGLIDITSKLGWVGKGLGLLGGIVLQLIGDSLKHNSALNDAYENLSQFGLVDVKGIQGMFTNLQNAGMTVEEIAKFSSILTSVSPSLATLGTTAAEGAKKVAESFTAIKNTDAEKSLRNLGYNSETMIKTFAEYQSSMGRLNLIQGKSTAQVAKESTKYAETLDQLSKLTGESRDEIQKKMDADAMDLAFRLKMQRMLGSNSEAEQKIGKEMRTAAEMSHGMGEDMAEGVRDMIASGGGAVTEASIKLQQSTGGAATSIIQQLNAGQISGIEANRQIAEAQHKQLTSISKGSMLFNDNLVALGHSAKQEEFYASMRGKTNEEVARIMKEQQTQEKGNLDVQRSANTQGVMANRNMQQVHDRLNQLVGVNVAGVFQTFMKMINEAAKQIAYWIKWMKGPDFTDLFMTTEDIQSKIAETTQKFDKANENLEKLKNSGKTDTKTQDKIQRLEKLKLDLLQEEIDLKEKLVKVEGTFGGQTSKTSGTLLDKIINVESRGSATAQAKGSSAYGLGQFTKGTFEDLARREDSTVRGKTWEQYKSDPALQRQALAELTQRNQATLAQNKIAATDSATYLAHFLGAGGVSKLYKAGDDALLSSVVGPDQIKANESVFRNLTTVRDLKLWAARKMGEDPAVALGTASTQTASTSSQIPGAKLGGMLSGPSSGYPVMLHGNEMVIPLPDATGISQVTSQSLDNQTKQVFSSNQQSSASDAVLELLAEKLDSVIEYLRKSNDTQENILTYTKA